MLRIRDGSWHTKRHFNQIAIALALIVLAADAASANDPSQATAATWTAPARAVRKPNPLALDTGAPARGKALFASACTPCHGAAGRGDGPAGSFLQRGGVTVHPRDLSDSALWAESDGALFWKISEGKAPMPAFHETFSETQLWELVSFLRTLAPKPATPTATTGGR